MLLERSRKVSCFKPDSDDTSEIVLPIRNSHRSCVKPDSDDTSEIVLLERFSPHSCVKPDSNDTSEIVLLERSSSPSCVKPDSDDMSEIALPPRDRTPSCFKSDSDDISETALLFTGPTPSIYSFPRFKELRLRACSSPVRYVILRLGTSSHVKFSIVCVVIELPISRRTAVAKFASGIETTLGRGSREITLIG